MNDFKERINAFENFLIGANVRRTLLFEAWKKRLEEKLKEKEGNWLDESFKYILAVVLGLAFLAGLYAITKDTILPTLTQKIKDGFNFKG